MKRNNKIVSIVFLLVFSFGVLINPTLAATKKKVVVNTTTKYFHQRKLVHKKAPIPKDPKPTKVELKKAKQQTVAGKVYIKTLQGWLAKGSTKKTTTKKITKK